MYNLGKESLSHPSDLEWEFFSSLWLKECRSALSLSRWNSNRFSLFFFFIFLFRLFPKRFFSAGHKVVEGHRENDGAITIIQNNSFDVCLLQILPRMGHRWHGQIMMFPKTKLNAMSCMVLQ
ncbi:hypothetical protein CDAR_229681 [Caerostris darwini]|uniref:Uncharacterized protein n=1 Tax=Caerostris darwini TaxID=1538125 RepID=A0AAV4Q1P3_9ARAC|nr:hypothetical protein CDAR_229681 [Caerostris darwini]